LAVFLLTFLLLNMNSVIEPRVHLVFAKYERPGLVPVLLFTWLFGMAASAVARMAFKTLRQLHDARARSRTDALEREVAAMKMAASPAPEFAGNSGRAAI
jgi:hypothetical protein